VLLRSALSRSRHLGLGSLVPWPIAVSTEFIVSNPRPHYEDPFHLANWQRTYVTGRTSCAFGANQTEKNVV
jgi:hypothetical protein